jgi:hypothetical protein
MLGEDWVQQVVNLMGQAVAVFTDVGTIVLAQEAQPNANQRDFLWRKPSTGITYNWDAGTSAWISPHPEPPNGAVRRWFEGTLTALLTYDGGDTNAPGTNSGPMWTQDTNYDGRSPMGPGVIPGSNPAKTLALSEDFGAGAVAGTAQNVPPHTHPLNADASIMDGDNIKVVETGVGGRGLQIGGSGPASTDLSVQANEFTGTQEASSVLHPVRGLYCIRRTVRVNYVGA